MTKKKVYRMLGTDAFVSAAKSLFRKGEITEAELKEIERRNEIQDIVDREDVVVIKEEEEEDAIYAD